MDTWGKGDGYVLTSLLVEMKCPEHGLERFQIKVVKKFNVKQDTIMPKFRSRPTSGDLSSLLVGRGISNRQCEEYLTNYFREKGMFEAILRIKMQV